MELARQLFTLGSRGKLELLLRSAHGAEYVGITRTAAKIAGEVFTYLVIARIRIFREQSLDRQHKPRRAISALQSVLFHPCLLDRMERIAVAQTFKSENFMSSGARG